MAESLAGTRRFFDHGARDLFVASFGALFLELLLIRWLPTSIYYLGYFKNGILLSTFLGFAAGCATRKPYRVTMGGQALMTAVLVVTVVLVENHISIDAVSRGEILWPQFGQKGVHLSLYTVLAVFFTASALIMYPYGQLVAEHFAAHPPLKSYGINVGASLLGIVAYSAICFLEMGPLYWFALALLPVFYFCLGRRRELISAAIAAVLCLGAIAAAQSPDDYWSPYHKITFPKEDGNIYNLRKLYTNNNGYQFAYDLSEKTMARAVDGDRGWELVKVVKAIHDSPYAFLKPRSVLIIGGGTGNEAAAAIRAGALRIHVVDIDPVIVELGRRHHPERAYDNPRVTVITDDARHYMATTAETYDLIIFGFLDSQSRLSSMSNIRLDNYVYTEESFEQARRLLAPGGVVQITYVAYAEFIRARLHYMLYRTFGQWPHLYFPSAKGFQGSVVLFAGPGMNGRVHDTLPGLTPVWPPPDLLKFYSAPERFSFLEPRVPTDDWPFLSIDSLLIPDSYAITLVIMLLISLLFIRVAVWSRGQRRIQPRLTRLLLQGAAFMLLETSTITRMALLLGSTWMVTSIAIALVLLSSLLAVFLVARGISISMELLIVCWVAVLAANYLVGFDTFLHFGRSLGVTMAAVLVYLPIVGSSLVFVKMFAASEDGAYHLGVNIFGAMIGGGLEYGAVMMGIRTNYLMCILLVLVFALIYLRMKKADACLVPCAEAPAQGR